MLCVPWLPCSQLCYHSGAWILSSNLEQLALSLVGLYPGILPIPQSHVVPDHLSIIQLLKDEPYLADLTPLSSWSPAENTVVLTGPSVTSYVTLLNMQCIDLSFLQDHKPSSLPCMWQAPNKCFSTKNQNETAIVLFGFWVWGALILHKHYFTMNIFYPA